MSGAVFKEEKLAEENNALPNGIIRTHIPDIYIAETIITSKKINDC